MKYAVIENGIVTNVILADEEFVRENYPDAIETDEAAIGDVYDGGVFTKPEIKPIVPEKVTPRQIRLTLARAGLLSQIEAALEDPNNKEAQISWEYSIEINRDDYLLNSFASSLGFTEQQLDQLFIMAESI